MACAADIAPAADSAAAAAVPLLAATATHNAILSSAAERHIYSCHIPALCTFLCGRKKRRSRTAWICLFSRESCSPHLLA